MSWEVRTMKSATSSSKSWFYPTLWKKNMARFWPVWALYGLVWLVALPLNLMTNYRGGGNWGGLDEGANHFANYTVLEFAGELSVILSVGFAILAAMAVFSYLYQSRSVGMLHALPVKREGLFLTNYLSGLSFLLLPAVAVFGLALLAEAAKGCLNAGALGLWLGCQVCYALFFYSFAVFCAMFTGHILALPAFYAILNGLATGLYVLVSAVLRQFVFGFSGIDGVERAALWLTPVAKLIDKVGAFREWDEAGAVVLAIRFQGFGYALVYALAGLVLAVLALCLYRRRSLETAGDVVAVSWVRPIFKYGVGLCAGLAFGSVLYAWLGWNLPQGAWTLLLFMLLCGAMGYFVAEMLLQKAFWVFQGSWKGCVLLLCAMTAATAVMELDLTGFERRVPDPDRVTSLTLHGPYTAPYDDGRAVGLDTSDPELIRLVTELHRAVVEEKDAVDRDRSDFDGWYGDVTLADGTVLRDIQKADSVQLRISYDLDTGAQVRRRYDDLFLTADMLADPDSAAARLQALINRPEVTWYGYFPADISGWRLVDAYLTVTDDGRQWAENAEKYGEEYADRYAEEVQAGRAAVPQEGWDDLLAALQSDLKAGRIGRRYLLDDAQRQTNCYYNDLELTFYVPEGQAAGAETALAADSTQRANRERTRSVTITVQKTATDTLAVLERLGLAGALVLRADLP